MKKVVVFNLGCKVNQYESDVLVKMFEDAGFRVCEKLGYADYYVINTCAVTSEAERKSRQAIARVRKFNPEAKIFVCGCASQNDRLQFLDKENVVTVKGIANKYALADLLEKGDDVEDLPCAFEDGNAKSTRTRSYIKVQDGCNNFCSYCIIPYLRGRSRSRAADSVIKEIKSLQGVKEVVLTGIDLSSYGKDIGTDLKELTEGLKDIDIRIRLGSLEVGAITKPLLESLRNLKAFCPQFHLSLQTGDDSVLKSMNRHYTTEEYYSKICLIREYFENACITTDIIAGFPTETESNFENTLEFVNRVKFSDIHIFPYSERKGTAAYKKYKPIDKAVVSIREKKLSELRDKLKKEYEGRFIGKVSEVLFEETVKGYSVGYNREYIRIYSTKNIPNNEIAEVKAVDFCFDGLKGE